MYQSFFDDKYTEQGNKFYFLSNQNHKIKKAFFLCVPLCQLCVYQHCLVNMVAFPAKFYKDKTHNNMGAFLFSRSLYRTKKCSSRDAIAFLAIVSLKNNNILSLPLSLGIDRFGTRHIIIM